MRPAAGTSCARFTEGDNHLMTGDLVQAWRAIRRMPMLAGVVVVSLGVGIGVNTAIFSWIQAVVLRPLPGVRDSGAFQLIEPRAETGSYPGVSWLEYQDVRARSAMVPEMIAFRMVPFSVGETGRTERAFGLLVSDNYFSALGLTPAFGRFFHPEEASAAPAPVIVVSHDYWRTRLAAAPDVVGRTMRVNGNVLTIVGVAPARFQGTSLGLTFDLWVPATLAPSLVNASRELQDRGLRGYNVMGRLRAGADVRQAQTELDRIMRELAAAYPQTNAGLQVEVLSFWLAPRGPQRMFATALFVLQGILLLLLLAVCGNTTNLMLARASARQREMGVRLALGAGRWRLVRLVMTENLLLSLAGASLGVAIAVWASDALRAVPILTSLPIKFQTFLDAGSIAFAIAIGLACGLLVGVAPAVQLAFVNPHAAIGSALRTGGRSVLRSTLMAVEVDLALVVLHAAGMFMQGFTETRGTDPGFRREGVFLAAYDLSSGNLDARSVKGFTTRLLERLRALPQVEAAAIAGSVPLDIHGFAMRSFTVEGRRAPDLARGNTNGASGATANNALDQALANTVTPGYFAVMGIPFRAGADFADLADTAAPPQAVVNEEFVRRFVSRDDSPSATAQGLTEAIGRRIQTRGATFVTAGVVRNSLSESFGEPPTPVIYLSYRDRPSARGEIHLRTRPGTELLLGPAVERIVSEVDPTQPIYNVRTLTDHVEQNLFLRRIPARMFVVLGPLLLVLAAIGIYAVVAYGVSQRTKEIGVRLAIGATAGRVIVEIVLDSLRVVVAGASVGWAMAVVLKLHLLRGPLSLVVFGGIPLILVLVAGAASWIPARRAATVDPMIALRQD